MIQESQSTFLIFFAKESKKMILETKNRKINLVFTTRKIVNISNILKVNNQRLNKSYIETIVGQWKRLKVETVEDAMHLTEKEHKKIKKMMESKKEKKSIYYKQKNKEESLPEWFDKEMEKENISKEEQEELNNLLENLT